MKNFIVLMILSLVFFIFLVCMAIVKIDNQQQEIWMLRLATKYLYQTQFTEDFEAGDVEPVISDEVKKFILKGVK
jgi:hypothetical protein